MRAKFRALEQTYSMRLRAMQLASCRDPLLAVCKEKSQLESINERRGTQVKEQSTRRIGHSQCQVRLSTRLLFTNS